MKKGKIIFTGNFWEYFVYNILLTLLTFITLGLGAFYQAYWNIKYFFNRMEIKMEE